jgi:aryl-alcohol dehydrogenase-like predicted oxidoreductase
MISAMRLRTFGRLGWPVSEIGYGMWGMAGWTGSDDAASGQALDRAVELGANFFDTAYAYGDGKSERLLRDALARHRGTRLYAATKVPPKNRRWPGKAETPIAEVFPYDYVVQMTQESRRNLGVERIDLQQLHVWNDASWPRPWSASIACGRSCPRAGRSRTSRFGSSSIIPWCPPPSRGCGASATWRPTSRRARPCR